MPSIFPEITTGGGVVVRDIAGNPTNPPDVHNAYVPPATFVASCEITALPTTCDARIEAKHINAIVSELLALAECFDANGVWDCTKLNNLCAAFNVWVEANRLWFDQVSIVGAGTQADPLHVVSIDCGSY